jgi:hypothetical protein
MIQPSVVVQVIVYMAQNKPVKDYKESPIGWMVSPPPVPTHGEVRPPLRNVDGWQNVPIGDSDGAGYEGETLRTTEFVVEKKAKNLSIPTWWAKLNKPAPKM